MGSRFINDDVKLKTNGRRAPRISIEELQEKLEGFTVADILSCSKETGLRNDVKYGCCMINKFCIDPADFQVNSIGNNLVGYHTLDNDFTFLGVGGFSEWHAITPMFTIIYWNGKKIRAYTPTYGNAINRDFKCFVGQAHECNLDIDFRKLTKKYIKEGLLPRETDVIKDVQVFEALYLKKYEVLPENFIPDFNSDDPKSWFSEAYLNDNGKIKDDLVMFNWRAIRKDIISHIRII